MKEVEYDIKDIDMISIYYPNPYRRTVYLLKDEENEESTKENEKKPFTIQYGGNCVKGRHLCQDCGHYIVNSKIYDGGHKCEKTFMSNKEAAQLLVNAYELKNNATIYVNSRKIK